MVKHSKVKKQRTSQILFTFQFHAGVETFFKTTSRAFFARCDSDGTGGTSEAHVILFILDGSFEETLATFTRKDAVMESRNFVATNRTRAVDELLARNTRLGS